MRLGNDLGIRMIEPQFSGKELPDLEAAKSLRAAADSAGIQIPSMGCGGAVPLSVKQSRAELDGQIDELLRFAETLGLPYIFTPVVQPPAGMPQAEAWEHVAQQGRHLAERLQRAGLGWGVEADGGRFVHTLERVEKMMAVVDHPNLHLNYDPTNLYLGGSDPLLAIERCGDRMVNGHIKDGLYRSDQRGEVTIGEGEVPWRAILSELVRRKIRIRLFVEHCKSEACVRAAAAWVKPLLAGLDAERT